MFDVLNPSSRSQQQFVSKMISKSDNKVELSSNCSNYRFYDFFSIMFVTLSVMILLKFVIFLKLVSSIDSSQKSLLNNI
jgi:hypothetical protein